MLMEGRMGGTERETAHAAQPPGLRWQSGQAESTFGAWVRRLRVGLDLTQEALAEQAGCATQTMRSFESGRRRPSRELALRLADSLRVPADEREPFLWLARFPVAPPEGDTPPVAEPPAVPPAPPSALEPLIGRHQELVQLHELLVVQRRRLVTLLGTVLLIHRPGVSEAEAMALALGASGFT
jgi:transcriptional regulator with XRE-family HTH domain